MSQSLLILILNIATPLIAGAIFGAVGLADKYLTATKYVYTSFSAWIYIVLSSVGGLGTSWVMHVMGMRVFQDELLNAFSLGLLAAGAFLGIITRIPVSKSLNSEAELQFRTLKDFIFKFLDRSISKRVMQSVETAIHTLGQEMDTTILLKEASRLIGGPRELSAKKKDQLKIYFDECASKGDYAEIIRELIKYYDISFIIKDLSKSISSSLAQERKSISLQSHQTPSFLTDLPEYRAAQIFALQKEAESTLYHLKQALTKMPTISQEIITNDHEWWTFTSITHGEHEVEKLDAFMKLIGAIRPSFEEIRNMCNHSNHNQQKAFMAIKRSNGNCVKVTISYTVLRGRKNAEWRIMGDWDLEKHMSNLDEVMDLIQKVVIPTRLL